MSRRFRNVAFVLTFLVLLLSAGAHFQLLHPSDDIVSGGERKTIDLDAIFTHPMDNGPVMEMGRPHRFGVLVAGERHDLLDTLQPVEVEGKRAYHSTYRLRTPADYVFYIEPAPYWEPAERKMIIHYTKVVVAGFGAEEGWDEMVGLPVEIEPLVRPYGLWTGNVFRGVVKHNGDAVPFAQIEVEYLDTTGEIQAPSSPYVTQVIKADAAGQFCYAMPRAGWWGFAALLAGSEKMENPEGREVAVELGGLIWVRTRDMK